MTALASAAPIAEASAATDPPPFPALSGLGNLTAFTFSPLSFTVPGVAVATAPPVIGQTFNGNTTVCVSPRATVCSP